MAKHPFSLSKELEEHVIPQDSIDQVAGGSRLGTITTLALGEEGGSTPPVISFIGNEDGGRKPLPPITTMALGEEGGRC